MNDSCLFTEKQNVTIAMRLDGMTTQAIANALGITRKSVKTRLQRAKHAADREDEQWETEQKNRNNRCR